jgi:uracil-DNA glycosylase
VPTRAQILEELGIGPEWIRRDRPAVAAAQPVVEALPVADTSPLALELGSDLDARAAAVLEMDWPALKACVAACAACPLAPTRTQTVGGVGDEAADGLFVGEGPGAEEDQRGEPFVGQAGRLLDNMLGAIGLKRGHDVYIANVVKCRPPGNRNPEPLEAERCRPFLQRQVDLIRPKLIVALGKVPATNLLGRDATIASLRGSLHEYRGIPLIVTYHPAYLLRNLHDKSKAWEDLCFARDTMARLKAAAA